jgi:hypothetical protein
MAMQNGSDAVNSNAGPNESFDALVDLMGSDDVVNDPRFGNHPNDGLKDAEGKLHLGKIHAFFAGGKGYHDVDDNALGDNGPQQQERSQSPDHNLVRHTKLKNHIAEFFSLFWQREVDLSERLPPSPTGARPCTHTSGMFPAVPNISRPMFRYSTITIQMSVKMTRFYVVR